MIKITPLSENTSSDNCFMPFYVGYGKGDADGCGFLFRNGDRIGEPFGTGKGYGDGEGSYDGCDTCGWGCGNPCWANMDEDIQKGWCDDSFVIIK